MKCENINKKTNKCVRSLNHSKEVHMIFSRYKEEKNIFKVIAKQEGISVAEVREQMELSIDEAFNSDNPETIKEFKKLFGNKKPSPEEFISKATKHLLKKKI